jgi:hypothetical protein
MFRLRVLLARVGAVALMAESDASSSSKLASAVNTIGRVVDLGGAAVSANTESAVNMVMDVLSLNADSVEVRFAACFFLSLFILYGLRSCCHALVCRCAKLLLVLWARSAALLPVYAPSTRVVALK